jgi:CHAD domain-containing protein
MPAPVARFRIPSRMSTRTVVASLRQRWTVAPDSPAHAHQAHRAYLDTADWRVFRAGFTLEADGAVAATNGSASPVALTLRDQAGRALAGPVEVAAPPGFAGDLPGGSAPWAEVAAAMGDRCLIPQAEMETRVHRFSLRNPDGKITARLVLERHTVAGSRPRVLRLVTVVPLRGYEATAARIAKQLSDSGLVELDAPVLALARAALRQSPPGRVLGPGVDLEPSMPAGQAVGAILGRLREQMLSHEDGVRAQLDHEFLHEWRVALRRARSIIRQVPGVLPPDDVESLGSELGWLGSVTSPVRDLDVYLEELAPDGEGELAPLVSYLVNRRVMAQGELVAALDSARFRRLLESWEALEGAPPDLAAAPESARPAAEVAARSIDRAHRRVLRRGAAIGPDTPPEALHSLRKRAKELRYLLECFQTLYPDDQRSVVVRELKALQDNLGEYQDCQVQAATLRTMADDLLDARTAPASTLMAMGRLADGLDERQSRARAEFDDRFRRFSSPDNRKRFASLTEPISRNGS